MGIITIGLLQPLEPKAVSDTLRFKTSLHVATNTNATEETCPKKMNLLFTSYQITASVLFRKKTASIEVHSGKLTFPMA